MNSPSTPAGFAPIRQKMEAEGLPEIAIETFARYFQLLRDGHTGLLSREAIEAVDQVPRYEEIAGQESAGAQALPKSVVLKLNGGLGTSMGMTQAKSLLKVKGDLTFLDVIVRQILHLRKTHSCDLPLVLMNSFRTRKDSLAALDGYVDLDVGLPLDFLQHKVPRLCCDDLLPVEWPADRTAEWCPPGHGDLYTALQTSGLLQECLDKGYEYAFLSNSDNLGATMDLSILGWFAANKIPFLMEVAARTEADKKGGHLARRSGGGLALRESAQCPPEEANEFQNIQLYRFFNTNNLWLNLRALDETLRANDRVLPLPMIRNEKSVDPSDSSSPKVYQLETAMGAALSVFDGAQALLVPRSRFAPVKTTNDLLVLWSDRYQLGTDASILPTNSSDKSSVYVDLDPEWFRHISQFVERFPHGAPSLQWCRSLTVRGNVVFGRGVVVRGEVVVHHTGEEPLRLPDHATLSG